MIGLSRFKLYIFDLDQTLVYTLHRFHTALNMTLLEYGGSVVGWSDFLRLYSRDKLNVLLPKNVGVKEFWSNFRRHMSGWIHVYDRPIRGSREVLEWVKKKRGVVVITTGRDSEPSHVWFELRVFGLHDHIDEVYTIRLQDPRDEDQLFSRRGLLRSAIDKV